MVQANAANQKQMDDINAQIAVLEKQLEAQKSSLSITTKGFNEDASTLDIIDWTNKWSAKNAIINPINGTVLVKYAEVTN